MQYDKEQEDFLRPPDAALHQLRWKQNLYM